MEEKKKCRCGHEYKMHDRDEGGRTICMLPTCVCNPSPSFPSPKEPEEEWSLDNFFDLKRKDGKKLCICDDYNYSEEYNAGPDIGCSVHGEDALVIYAFIKSIISQAKSQGAREAYENVIEKLSEYNVRSDCEPEWHDGFSDAIDKVEELSILQSNLKEKI